VYLPIDPGLETSTLRIAPARSRRWPKRRMRTTPALPLAPEPFVGLTTLLRWRKGQPRPRQRNAIDAPTGPLTDSSRSLIPRLRTIPLMRTIGNGAISRRADALPGGWPLRSMISPPGAASATITDIFDVAETFELSVTVRPTLYAPARGKVFCTYTAELSSNCPSPSRSQDCRLIEPSGSVDVEKNVTGCPATGLLGIAAIDADGGRLRIVIPRVRDASLPRLSVTCSRT
jgi:hypothetical protein